MNQVSNVTLLFFSIPVMLFCIFVGFDLQIEPLRTTGRQLPYISTFQWGFGAVIIILLARRSTKRWTGMRLMQNEKRFVWIQAISKERKSRVILYNLLEGFVLLALCIGIHDVYPEGKPIYLAYGLGFLDSVIFTIWGAKRNAWKIGVTKKAIVLADRDVKVLYFSGLRKMSIQHDTLYFEYLQDLHMMMPVNAAPNVAEVVQQVTAQVNLDKVFLDDSIKKHL